MTNSSRLLLLAAVFMLAPLACSDALDDTPKVVDEATETDETTDPSNADTSDPTDASDTSEANDETDTTETTEPSDDTDVSDPADESDAADASDPTDASDLTGPDIIVDPPIAEPVEPCLDPENLEATCVGAARPEWSLEDFHPASSRFGETYGLDAFDGTVTLVSLHAAWCGYCRTQALYMEQMLAELRAEGYDIEFITVNKINAAEEGYQRAMIYQLSDENEIQYDETGEPIYRCTYPLVQDVEEINAWELHAGKKDDFYIYGTDGMLARFLPSGTEEFSTRLSTEEGYTNLKGALIEVLEGIVAPEESEEPTSEETTETEEEGAAD